MNEMQGEVMRVNERGTWKSFTIDQPSTVAGQEAKEFVAGCIVRENRQLSTELY
mgnify:CR=1 FL=1